MKVIIEQPNKEIASMVRMALKLTGKDLRSVCQENNLDYSTVYRKIHNKKVDLKYVQSIVEKIDPNTKLIYSFSVSLARFNQVIINQKL